MSDGRCCYRLDGPASGNVVVLIHGATVPAWQFDRLVPYLTDAGYRTLRPDLFGHGCSDRPRCVYDHALFVRQLLELMDVVGVVTPAHVFGLSLGACVAARAVRLRPERFSRLVLAAPLVDFTINAPSIKLLACPLLGEILMTVYVLPMLVRRRTQRYRELDDGRFVDLFKRQLRKPGFGRALLSLFRSGALGDQRDGYRALAHDGRPVLVVRGADDPIVTRAQTESILALLPGARYRELRDTAHSFVLTHPEKIAPLVLEFLAEAHARPDVQCPQSIRLN